MFRLLYLGSPDHVGRRLGVGTPYKGNRGEFSIVQVS